MFCYHYFVKRAQIPYTYIKKFQCIRVPEGDTRFPEFKKRYASADWDVFIAHHFQPTEQDEIFKLKLHFQAWDAEFEIKPPDDESKKELF